MRSRCPCPCHRVGEVVCKALSLALSHTHSEGRVLELLPNDRHKFIVVADDDDDDEEEEEEEEEEEGESLWVLKQCDS